MYIKNDEDINLITPSIISHGSTNDNDFQSRFIFNGCRDYTAEIVVKDTINFLEENNNLINFQNYSKNLLLNGLNLLNNNIKNIDIYKVGNKFGDNLFPIDLYSPQMKLLPLPIDIIKNDINNVNKIGNELQNILFYKYNIEIPVKNINNRLFLRISSNIYNTIEDFDRLSYAINDIIKKK